MNIEIHLSHESANASWQDNAVISFQEQKINIHFDQDDTRIRHAARKIAGLNLAAISLQGDAWTLQRQWQFFLGFDAPKNQTEIAWAALSADDQTNFENRLRCFRFAKQLVNETPEILSPAALATQAGEFLKGLSDKVSYEIISGEDLPKNGYTGIYEVGRGSDRPPCLLKLSYEPEGTEGKAPAIALVGKGITFDSGGYSLKANESMFSMKCDMAGAATVSAALGLAILSGLKSKVSLLLCCAENLVSGHAYKLGDILKYKNGVSVEIANTDAEGRLVLADGLIVADELGAGTIIDAATLTGAAMVALGTEYNAVFCMNDELRQTVLNVAAEQGEAHWPLPLAGFHQEACPSQFADTCNSRPVKGGGFGGASNAAGFLSRFVKNPQKWLHLDLAAAYSEKGDKITGPGASGHGILTIAALLEQLN